MNLEYKFSFVCLGFFFLIYCIFIYSHNKNIQGNFSENDWQLFFFLNDGGERVKNNPNNDVPK